MGDRAAAQWRGHFAQGRERNLQEPFSRWAGVMAISGLVDAGHGIVETKWHYGFCGNAVATGCTTSGVGREDETN